MKHYLTPEGSAEVQAEIRAHQQRLAELRASRLQRHLNACAHIQTTAAIESFRKAGESMHVAGQTFRTMDDRIEHAAIKARAARFTGESPLSCFGSFE